MKIFEFIAEFCQDLVNKSKQEKELIDLNEFAHDDVITDAEGNKIPVVCVDGLSIPVGDFLSMDKSDFVSVWKTPGCSEAYDNYISALEILEGEEALSRIRKAITAERERLSADVELVTEL